MPDSYVTNPIEFNDSDLVPKLSNIVFVEGVAGAGKSTLYRLVTKLLDKTNPATMNKGIWLAHSSTDNAKLLLDSFEISDSAKVASKTFDKESLLNFISGGSYRNALTSEGDYKYYLGEDLDIVNGEMQVR